MNKKLKNEGQFLDALKSIRQQIDGFERSATYRKFAELVLIESEERYRTLFEGANDAILLGQTRFGKLPHIFPCAKPLVACKCCIWRQT